jgi:hypothetical protein
VAVRRVAAYVTAPHDGGARSCEIGGEAGDLRVVKQDDVAWTDDREQLRGIGAQNVLVIPVLRFTERAAITESTVEAVVDALRDGEEIRVAVDDKPPRIDSDSTRVREECPQHLGDAPAGRRGVDVHHDSAREHVAGRSSELVKPFRALRPDERREPLRREGMDVDFLELHQHPCFMRAPCTSAR